MVEEGIRSSEKTARDVDDFEIKISEVEQLSHLTTIEVLCLMEVHQVLVIGKDLDREGGTMEIVSPRFQGADDCQEFSVVDVIDSLCRDK